MGGAAAFGLDALTFLVSAALLLRVRARPRGEPAKRSTVLAELKDGGGAVRQRPWIWGTIGAFSAALLFALAPFYVLGATVSDQVYGTVAVFGFANAAWGLGTVTGALIGSRWSPHRPMRAAMLVTVPWPGAIALYAVGPPLAVLYPVMAVSGAGLGLFAVWWETALAQRVPAHLLSRVSARDWMGSLALLPAGYLLAGPAAEALGAVDVLVGGRAARGTGLRGRAAAALHPYTPPLRRLGAGARRPGLTRHPCVSELTPVITGPETFSAYT